MTIDERLEEIDRLYEAMGHPWSDTVVGRTIDKLSVLPSAVAHIGHLAEQIQIQCRLASPDLAESARQGVAVES